ncbi:hypothetical protein [Pedobacter jeongneungensis]|uniref:hypothetical protein n=1 Tax=Pedobacter jeongneungensis TaxID=947309 RepID=UPI0004687510|nr:hypothetical protein [Pedobacter jeongneungensis]
MKNKKFVILGLIWLVTFAAAVIYLLFMNNQLGIEGYNKAVNNLVFILKIIAFLIVIVIFGFILYACYIHKTKNKV